MELPALNSKQIGKNKSTTLDPTPMHLGVESLPAMSSVASPRIEHSHRSSAAYSTISRASHNKVHPIIEPVIMEENKEQNLNEFSSVNKLNPAIPDEFGEQQNVAPEEEK